jgi:glycosyltransferase involved in cell wall biosynthesis
MGARVIHNDWPGHRQQKQYATDQADHDWIFSIDADEKVSDELAESIQAFLSRDPTTDTCCKVNRLSEYLGQWMKHGSWHPDWIVRLFNRKKTHWGGENPHDRVIPTEKTIRLNGFLYHWPYKDLSDHLDYINFYTTIMAREKQEKGVKGTPLKALSRGVFKLFRDYFLKLGILDGSAGLICATTGAFYTYMKYLKLWELQTFSDSKD